MLWSMEHKQRVNTVYLLAHHLVPIARQKKGTLYVGQLITMIYEIYVAELLQFIMVQDRN